MTGSGSGLPDFESFEWEREDSSGSGLPDDGFGTLYEAAPVMPDGPEQTETPQPVAPPDRIPGDMVGSPPGVAGESFSRRPPLMSSQARPSRTLSNNVPGGGTSSNDASSSGVPSDRVTRRRGEPDIDPLFAYLVLMALSFGSTPLATGNPIERYTLLWTLLGLSGLYWTISSNAGLRISLRLNDLLRGGAWGLALGLPLLLIGTDVLFQTSERIFIGMPSGAVFQSIVFVMGTTETLFFRGMVQEGRSWRTTAVLASIWSILMFFPTLDVFKFPMLALIIGTFIVMLSALYSYVRYRHGLASAWICQVVMSLLWLLLPRFLV